MVSIVNFPYSGGAYIGVLHVILVDYKNPLYLNVVDRYLQLMGDKTIPDEAPPALESFHPP